MKGVSGARARMAKSADAADLKSAGRKAVGVQVPLRAPLVDSLRSPLPGMLLYSPDLLPQQLLSMEAPRSPFVIPTEAYPGFPATHRRTRRRLRLSVENGA
jgi:hypothetical protein